MNEISNVLIFINAIVIALMAMYIYQNERKIERMSARHEPTGMEMYKYLRTILNFFFKLPCFFKKYTFYAQAFCTLKMQNTNSRI